MYHFISNLPPLAEVSPITVVGVGVTGIALLLYVIRPLPEFLYVIFTALMYAVVPMIRYM